MPLKETKKSANWRFFYTLSGNIFPGFKILFGSKIDLIPWMVTGVKILINRAHHSFLESVRLDVE